MLQTIGVYGAMGQLPVDIAPPESRKKAEQQIPVRGRQLSTAVCRSCQRLLRCFGRMLSLPYRFTYPLQIR